MNVTNKFNIYLTIYSVCNILFIVTLFLIDERCAWDLTSSLMFLFVVFAVPVLNAVISLIIKLFNYKTYSWSNFAVSIIAMAVVFITNFIF